jgi:hypothetical protein
MFSTRHRLRTAAAILTTIALSSASTQAETLRWQFSAGQKFSQEMVQDMDSSIELGGQKINTIVKQTIDSQWSVNKVDDQGIAEITQVISRIRMQMDGASGISTKIDTASDDVPKGLAATLAGPLKAMTNAPFEMRMNSRGEVLDVKVAKETIEALRNLPGADKLGGMFSEEGLVNMIKQGTPSLPAGNIQVGYIWNSKLSTKLPQLGTMATHTEMTYQGPEQIDGKTQQKISMRLTTSVAAADNPLVKVSIKEQDASGTMRFDNQAGHISNTEMKQKMVMQMSISGKTFDQTINQTVTLIMKAVQ